MRPASDEPHRAHALFGNVAPQVFLIVDRELVALARDNLGMGMYPAAVRQHIRPSPVRNPAGGRKRIIVRR